MGVSPFTGTILVLCFLLLAALLFFWRRRSFGLSGGKKEEKAQPPSSPTPGKTADQQLLHSYFKGLNYVLSNDTDRAVAEFIKVAQVNSATSEIYLALGQLFRKTGEVERAIRIHRNLLLRSSLPDSTRLQTIFEIGLDYKQAGLIERARQTFEELQTEAPTFVEALEELGSIYELCREWDKAIEVQKKLAALGNQESEHVLAHLTAEMAKEAEQREEHKQALQLYRRAIEIDPGCVDAWLHLGDLQLRRGQEDEAIAAWEKGFSLNPDLTFMTVSRLAALPAPRAQASQERFFQANLERYGDNINFIAAYINFLIDQGEFASAAAWIGKVLNRHPDCAAVFKLTGKLVQHSGKDRDYRELLQTFFQRFQPLEKPYQCRNCGCFLEEVLWKCPKCYHWDTIVPR